MSRVALSLNGSIAGQTWGRFLRCSAPTSQRSTPSSSAASSSSASSSVAINLSTGSSQSAIRSSACCSSCDQPLLADRNREPRPRVPHACGPSSRSLRKRRLFEAVKQNWTSLIERWNMPRPWQRKSDQPVQGLSSSSIGSTIRCCTKPFRRPNRSRRPILCSIRAADSGRSRWRIASAKARFRPFLAASVAHQDWTLSSAR